MTGGKMKIAKCHPTRKVQAREMCKSCYDKWLKSVNPVYKKAQMSNTTEWAKKNPEKMKIIQERRKIKDANDPTVKLKQRNQALKRQYGITHDDYLRMLDTQNGACKLCYRKPGERKLHVDHCHRTGRVRGLLCHQCNWYLGTIEQDINIMSRIVDHLYLKEAP